MHDALISELARIGNLTVISRRSTLHYKENTLTVPQIARELNVAMIVEGSVFKSGDEVRIQVQLVGSQPERHLLAHTYSMDLSSVLKLQGEITQDITEKIKVTLTPQEQSRLGNAYTIDSAIYTQWLKGNFHLGRRTEVSFRRALAFYQEAIERDADYAPAYAGLTMAYIGLGGWHASGSPNDVIRLATKAAEQALTLDPAVAEAYFALGQIRSTFEWDWTGAERAFKQGIALNPSDTYGRIEYANFLTAMGRFDESIEIGKQTLELAHLARLESVRQTLPPALTGIIGQLYALVGQEVEARALVSQLMKRRAREFVPASALAQIYVGLGEDDEALRWLEIAYEERNVSLVWLKEIWS